MKRRIQKKAEPLVATIPSYHTLLPELDRQIAALFNGCRMPEGVDAVVDEAGEMVIKRRKEYVPPARGPNSLQAAVQFRELYHERALKLARRAKARIAEAHETGKEALRIVSSPPGVPWPRSACCWR